ncbi:uncharacterized protein LOC113147635 [Cyclospora cayetanensis]|uniref:Uncharacterized protein LOC113147635 n=1 Tax=Cyclospora cayetanensis TaxID=88456 RepID=A0A6P6S352_9EIME|nr:uncharacterized protein LOC113147635 [Cyclospora cayetanensis]
MRGALLQDSDLKPCSTHSVAMGLILCGDLGCFAALEGSWVGILWLLFQPTCTYGLNKPYTQPPARSPTEPNFPPAWTACLALVEPGTAIGSTIQSIAAAAMRVQQGPQRQQQQPVQPPEKVLQSLEVCLGAGWVAACARDVVGSFHALGSDAELFLFQLCDPQGNYPQASWFVGELASLPDAKPRRSLHPS